MQNTPYSEDDELDTNVVKAAGATGIQQLIQESEKSPTLKALLKATGWIPDELEIK